MISPGLFIPLFESNGLIQALDYYVWSEAAAKILNANIEDPGWKDDAEDLAEKYVDEASELASKYDDK